MDQQLKRVNTYPLKSVHVDRILILLFDKNDSAVLAVFASEQHLTSSKNAMEQEEEKKKRQKCKRNGRPKRPAHISSLLTGLRVTPGILVKLYVEDSVRVGFKRMKEIGWFMVSLQNFMACFT